MLLIAACVAGGALFVAAGSGEAEDGYTVQATFDNAAFAAEGEDVKVAGAVVGEIDSLDVTDGRKAVLNLRIEDSEFTPFHADARCSIRSEGILAVKYVDCHPGSASRPELEQIEGGDDAGAYELSVGHTQSPVDLDIVQRIYRQPTAQQLTLLINELGTGLAGGGEKLNAAIHRANPSLRETDRVLRILASENKRLGQLATDADAVLGPLSAQRERLASFIGNANRTYEATAARSEALAEGIERLPRFLRELRPAMTDLGRLADEATPVLANVRVAAPGLNRATEHLPRFAKVGVPATKSLGRYAEQAGPDILDSKGLVNDLADLGAGLRPPASKLDKLTGSLGDKEAIENLSELLFNAANAANGFDEAGHYARFEFLSGACSEYTSSGFFGCDAQWGPTEDAAGPITEAARAAGLGPSASLLDYLLADGKKKGKKKGGKKKGGKK